jgi:hypothetical protein
MNNDSTERNVFNNIEKRNFFSLVESRGVDIGRVCVKRKEYNEHYHKFNILVDYLKEKEGKSLIDMAIYLHEDYFDKLADVWACFDENNTWAMQEEAMLINRKECGKSILDNFMFL